MIGLNVGGARGGKSEIVCSDQGASDAVRLKRDGLGDVLSFTGGKGGEWKSSKRVASKGELTVRKRGGKRARWSGVQGENLLAKNEMAEGKREHGGFWMAVERDMKMRLALHGGSAGAVWGARGQANGGYERKMTRRGEIWPRESAAAEDRSWKLFTGNPRRKNLKDMAPVCQGDNLGREKEERSQKASRKRTAWLIEKKRSPHG